MAQPRPNMALPTTWRRSMASVRTAIGSPVTAARRGRRVSNLTPAKPTATAAPIIRNT